jgi:hypothetical protein
MVHRLNAREHLPSQPAPPERRRVIVVGAGAAGLAAAFHLGEHSLLLESRQTLEDSNDHSHDLTLGTARGRAVGAQERHSDGQRPGLPAAEREALRGTNASASTRPMMHVARWEPPNLAPGPITPTQEEREERAERLSLRALIPLLRGELRFGATVVRISPSRRLVELADGARFVYDKLLSTVPLMALTEMVLAELPWRIRCDETLRYWLNARDIEVADFATRVCYGDMDEFSAGKRVAAVIKRALADKFRTGTAADASGKRLFEPRIVMR